MAFSGKRTACPKCRAEGKDSKFNHLSEFEDGTGGYCYQGGHGVVKFDREEGERISSPSYEGNKRGSGVDMALAATYPILEYAPRLLTKEAMEHFGVRTAVSQEDASPEEHWYPYHDPADGSITGYKVRGLRGKTFRTVGKVKGFFGQHLVTGGKFLIACEGEGDILAAYAMMRKLKPERAPYNVVSIPFGADEKGTLDKEIKNQIEWLSSFEKVVLCFDNDGPGKATATALAEFLCSHTNVSIASLPLKDTAAMCEAGREQEWAQAINNARKYVSDQISVGTENKLEDLLVPLKRGIYFPFLPKTCNKMRGFRTGEATVLIAPEKVGKSSLLRQMTHFILTTTDEHVGGFFLEESAIKTRQSILAYHAGVPLNEFRANPKCADRHKIQEAYDTLLPRLHLFTHKGKTITDDVVERKVEYLVKALGCKSVMFDHASFVLGTRQTNDERRELDMLMTKLSRSAEMNDYRLFLVAHIKRGAKEQSRSNREQKYPYWEYLTSDAGRGSGAFEQLCHNMIAIEKQILDPENDNTRGMVRTRVLLAREWGVSGLGDYLSFDERGQFTPIKVQY